VKTMASKAWTSFFLVAVLATAFGHATDQTTVAFDSHQSSIFAPFRLVDGRIFVDVGVNGEGPFAFMFDTGGNAVISTKLAERLHLSAGNTETGTGTGEKPVTAVDTTMRELRMGELRLSNIPFHASSFDDAPAVFGEQPLDGIIGFPILEHLIVDQATPCHFPLDDRRIPPDVGAMNWI
jgi:hypothetical protein